MRIGNKAELLATRYTMLLSSNRQLREELAERDATIVTLRRQLQQLQVENEHLTVVSNILPTRESLEQTKAYVSNLVREIDACVDDLIRDV